jgi:predicted ATP-dependent serine protease
MNIWSSLFSLMLNNQEYKVYCTLCRKYVPTVSDGMCEQCIKWRKHQEEKRKTESILLAQQEERRKDGDKERMGD